MPRQDAELCQPHSLTKGFGLSGFMTSPRSSAAGRRRDVSVP